MKRNRQTVKDDLAHVYWIGGSGCAGKTTIADMIANEYGFRVYHGDEHWEKHIGKAVPHQQPTMCRLRELELEAFFLLPPKEYAKTSFDFFEEDFEMIIDDLYSLPREKLIVEGVSIEPKFVYEVADPHRIIFMIAFEAFQREHFLSRNFATDWFQDFADPKGVFENLMHANALLAKSVHDSARELGLNVIITDERSTIPESMEIVKKHFRL